MKKSIFELAGGTDKNENKPVEPVHVHIAKGKPSQNATKVWLEKTSH